MRIAIGVAFCLFGTALLVCAGIMSWQFGFEILSAGSTDTVRGVEQLSADAARALEDIVTGTLDAGNHARRIAETAGRQEESALRLREQMDRVAAVSARTLEDASTTARRASEAARSHTELERTVRELTGVADRLKVIARHFSHDL